MIRQYQMSFCIIDKLDYSDETKLVNLSLAVEKNHEFENKKYHKALYILVDKLHAFSRLC